MAKPPFVFIQCCLANSGVCIPNTNHFNPVFGRSKSPLDRVTSLGRFLV